MKKAAAQKRVRQFFLVVGGDDDDRAMAGADGFVGLVDVELHAVEFLQQIVRKLDIGLVDLVDQQHHALARLERFPQLTLAQVVAHVVDAFHTELGIAQAAHRVVLVQTLLRLGGGLDVPGDQPRLQRARQLLGQQGLARARLALDQQRPLQRDGRIDREAEIRGGNVGVGALESHGMDIDGDDDKGSSGVRASCRRLG